MIRHQLQTSMLRFYDRPSDDPYEPYSAICTLVWESDSTVWITGLHGALSRPLLRELIHFCASRDVKLVKAHRASTRQLPMGKPVGEHIEIDVGQIATRMQVLPITLQHEAVSP